MPNQANVRRPFVLVGPGRSGTSLVSKLLSLHPEVSFVGETANFIFGIWDAFDQSAPITKAITVEGHSPTTIRAKAATTIQETFCSVFPDTDQYWMHKPIGVPEHIRKNYKHIEAEKSAEAYWDILKSCFPEGKFFTILRHPFDVILSSQSHWGWDEGWLWESLSWQSQIITHPSSPVNYAVSFDDLMQNKEQTTQALCSFLGIQYAPDMMNAFKKVWASDSNQENEGSFDPSRKESWGNLDLDFAKPEYLENVRSLFQKFNVDLDLPGTTHLPPKTSPPQDEPSKKELQKVIDNLRHQIDRMNFEFSKRINTQSFEFNNRNQKINDEWKERNENLEAYIAELKEGNQWLVEQKDNWQKRAESLESYVSELKEGNQWLSEQSNAWQAKVEELEKVIVTLNNQIDELTKGNQQ